MRIADRLQAGYTTFSFEFSPPRSDEAAAALERTIAELRPLQPAFVSVTYGAGGSTRGRTIELASHIKRDTGIEAMAHLSAVGHAREEIHAILERLQEAGVENIMAIRGDPPLGEASFQPAPDGFRYGSELIGFIREAGFDYCVGGGAYPEGHLESAHRWDDVATLRRKVDAGATFFVTQLFFDNAFYYDFVERARAAGIAAPIVAGIMPIINVEQIRRITRQCGATVPARLSVALDRCTTPREARDLGVAWATEQCRDLLDHGVPGIHFYTLNGSLATRRIMRAIGRYPD